MAQNFGRAAAALQPPLSTRQATSPFYKSIVCTSCSQYPALVGQQAIGQGSLRWQDNQTSLQHEKVVANQFGWQEVSNSNGVIFFRLVYEGTKYVRGQPTGVCYGAIYLPRDMLWQFVSKSIESPNSRIPSWLIDIEFPFNTNDSVNSIRRLTIRLPLLCQSDVELAWLMDAAARTAREYSGGLPLGAV